MFTNMSLSRDPPPTPRHHRPRSAGLNSGSANDNKRTQHCRVIHDSVCRMCVWVPPFIYFEITTLFLGASTVPVTCVFYICTPQQAVIASHLEGKGEKKENGSLLFAFAAEFSLEAAFCACHMFLCGSVMFPAGQ